MKLANFAAQRLSCSFAVGQPDKIGFAVPVIK
jgi:hypothetical protein